MKAPLLLAAAALGLVACSPSARFGDKARYAPDYRGYVIGDPDHLTFLTGEVVVLRDPVTQRKVRCREDLGRWLAPATTSLSRSSRDENLRISFVLVLFPLDGAGVTLAAPGSWLVTAAGAPALPGRSRSSKGLVKDAVTAMNRRDYSASASLLERALSRDEHSHGPLDWPESTFTRTGSPALYYLGLSYAALGRSREATVALTEFVETSGLRDEKAYALAEKWLASLGKKDEACASQEEVPIRWADAR